MRRKRELVLVQDQEKDKIIYHPSRKIIYWILIVLFYIFYIYNQSTIHTRYAIIRETSNQMLMLSESDNISADDINHYVKAYYDKIYDLEYDYISSKFLLYTFVLFSLICVMTILEMTGVFVVFYKYKNIPYK